jgi:hypothetical protein
LGAAGLASGAGVAAGFSLELPQDETRSASSRMAMYFTEEDCADFIVSRFLDLEDVIRKRNSSDTASLFQRFGSGRQKNSEVFFIKSTGIGRAV